MNTKRFHVLLMLAVGVGIWFCPVPLGVTSAAWHLVALFVATIIGFILKPIPNGAIALISITCSIFAGILKPAEALSGFADPTIWLIVSSFMFARSFMKTGLGRRIAYLIISKLGDSTLKLSYSLIFCDLVLAPATPSAGARAGALVFPVVRSMSSAFDSEPGPTARRIGAFLMQASYHGDAITCCMFMTASAANTLLIVLATQTFHVQISWGIYALAAIVPGLISLAVIPYFLYKVYPPEILKTPEAKEYANKQLNNLGPISLAEKIVIATFICMLILWSTSQFTHLDPTLVAMMGVSAMLIANVITWEDVISEKTAWDTMIWMGSLMTLAGVLNKLGLISWFAQIVATSIVGISWPVVLTILALVYLYAHYVFASMTAHATALFPAFATVVVAAGAPLYLTVFIFAFATHISMSLTHYAAAPTPIFFGAGYVEQKTWWKLGFMVSMVNVAIWGGVGPIWWHILGLW